MFPYLIIMIPEVFSQLSWIRTITYGISFNKETKNKNKRSVSDDMFPYQRMITHVTGLFYDRISHRRKDTSYISQEFLSTAVDCQISFMNHTGFPSIKKSRWERSEYGNYVFPIREWSQRLPQDFRQ